MNVIYVGETVPGTTSAMRCEALVELGHCVTRVNSAPPGRYGASGRTLWRRVRARLVDVPSIKRGMRVQLLRAIKQGRPDVVYVDKGTLLAASTLQEARELSPTTVFAHFNPDDPIGANHSTWKGFIASIPYYDIHFVPRRQNVKEYELLGARKVIFQLPSRGYDPAVHKPSSRAEEVNAFFDSQLCFVGNLEREREHSMRSLMEAGVAVTIWGEEWRERLGGNPCATFRPAVFGEDYGKALACSGIGLGFLRKANRDGHTSRSIEIPACGAMLLAERTEDHLELFAEGREAEFFSDDAELIDKARYYCENDKARLKIAHAGLQRCESSKYDYRSLMERRLNFAIEHVGK